MEGGHRVQGYWDFKHPDYDQYRVYDPFPMPFLFHSLTSCRGFNFFGLSVTRNVSATARSTIDTCRTLFIWIVSLFLGWETFKWLQVAGFALLVYGTFLFNGIVQPPMRSCVVSR